MRLSSRVPMVTASGCPLCVTGRTIAGTTPMRGHAVRTCYSAIIATCTNIVYDGFARSIVGASILLLLQLSNSCLLSPSIHLCFVLSELNVCSVVWKRALQARPEIIRMAGVADGQY